MPTPREGSERRLLIVACDYDADASPQGLRWVALSRELAVLGWDVEVLTWRTPSRVSTPHCVRVHAVPGGPYARLRERFRRRRSGESAPGATPAESGPSIAGSGAPPAALNWKGRLERRLQALASLVMYPDLRREGMPSLRSALNELMRRNGYAAIVLSHEPPFALELLQDVVARGIPVVADLGDPVCAIYTPGRWRRRARALEAKVCGDADAVVVTSASTLRLLERRHGSLHGRSAVITQGFTPGAAPVSTALEPAGGRLKLVYTGRFYRFRDPGPVLDTVATADGVELELAVPELPGWLEGTWRKAVHIRVLGRLSHDEAVRLQGSADVLLVIGNDDPAQTPGKLYEYFGMRRPILYVARHPADPAAELVTRLRRGCVVVPERDAIAAVIAELAGLHRDGQLASRFDLSDAAVSAYAWPQLARRYSDLLARVRPVDA